MKKNKLKDAKFFCESCGSEVPGNAKVCPICGKFFAAVRCPKCGRTGTSDDFEHGCPTCGYAVDLTAYFANLLGDNEEESPKKKNKSKKNKIKKFKNIKVNTYSGGYTKSDSNKYNESSLPAWIYIITIVVFLAVMVLLYSCL